VCALRPLPRLLIAGISGGSGKTLVSLGLLLALRRTGIAVRAFKKGPDYIDPAWLGWASSQPARNLDTYLMGNDVVYSSLIRHGVDDGVNVIEGARGLYDGFNAAGTHSSAVLSKWIKTPVVLIVNATKITRTAAALVLGCQKMDPDVPIGGVILNNVNGRRHEQILREAITGTCGIPVLGVIAKAAAGSPLPERHLGLVPPQEYVGLEALAPDLLEVVGRSIDLDALVQLARSAPPLEQVASEPAQVSSPSRGRIGVIRDAAFSFYYPENLEALEQAGAELICFSALAKSALPDDLSALYIGGGFPETHAEALALNRQLLDSIRLAAESGLPIYAECGGLMLLSRALQWKGSRYEMANVFPFEVEISDTVQGHGYCELQVDTPNPFFAIGSRLRGHEFHYSRIVPTGARPSTACQVSRGTGCFQGRDAAIVNHVWASYTHLHALATPEWAKAVVGAAGNYALLSPVHGLSPTGV
jgi:cobyrinic acid a,c-diamide synthase